MKLHVTNLGPIRKGEVDLSRRITLFCGENSTGKTFMSFVIFGLLRNILYARIGGSTELGDTLIEKGEAEIGIDIERIVTRREKMVQLLKGSMDQLFGLSPHKAQKLFQKMTAEMPDDIEALKEALINTEIHRTDYVLKVNVEISKKAGEAKIKIRIVDPAIEPNALKDFRVFVHSYIDRVLSTYPIRAAVFFPVERNSIYTFSKQLSIKKQEAFDQLVRQLDNGNEISGATTSSITGARRYTLPVKIGLDTADDLNEVKKERSEYYEFAEILENELLKGKLTVSDEGELQLQPTGKASESLPIQISASVVKILSSLIVYLKHLAKKEDLLIIDEPENNLHPESQIVLARALAKIANKGLRLLISTHSDYIVRELNNLMLLSDSTNKELVGIRKRMGVSEDETIAKGQLGVYCFRYPDKRSKKTDIVAVAPTDGGFAVEEMDRAIRAQNMWSDKIYYASKYPN